MHIPLGLLNLGLRPFVKWPLKRVRQPAVLRRRFARSARQWFRLPPRTHLVFDRMRRPDASRIPALWVSRDRPDRRRIILYLHGGAYLAGSPETHRHLGAALAGAAGGRAVLPDYHLAPEHPFPAALEDALACYRALLERGYAPSRIAVAGDSAGGGLAAALCLAAERDALPAPACLALFSPWADLRADAPSLARNARRDPMLPAQRMPEVIGHYLQGAAPDQALASPLLGAFAAPPPALIMVGRSEILLDDAIGLAETLRKSGGNVRLEIWPRVPHAWPIFFGVLRAADDAVAEAGRFIAHQTGDSD